MSRRIAAFLLGDEIEVTTRHAFAKPDEGLRFSARLDDEFISLTRVRALVGTTIRIKIPDHMKSVVERIVPGPRESDVSYHSNIGHYFLKEPSLLRYRPDGTILTSANWLPQPDEDVSQDWRWFTAPGFERIFWTYADQYPRLACNGILIEPSTYQATTRLSEFIFRPRMSVFDREGSLPVNLQRNGLQAPIPFENELLASICDDLIAHTMIEAPTRCNSEWFKGSYEGFFRYYEDWPAWLISQNGFVLNEARLVIEFEPRFIVIAIGGEADLAPRGEEVQSVLGADGLLVSILPNAFPSYPGTT